MKKNIIYNRRPTRCMFTIEIILSRARRFPPRRIIEISKQFFFFFKFIERCSIYNIIHICHCSFRPGGGVHRAMGGKPPRRAPSFFCSRPCVSTFLRRRPTGLQRPRPPATCSIVLATPGFVTVVVTICRSFDL